MQFLYCWKQDDNTQQPCRQGAGNVFGPSNGLLYLYTRTNLRALDCHNWWVEYPQFQRPRRELWNRRCLESMQLDRVDNRPKPDLLQEEEEEVGHHLPLQNAWEEQIQMIIPRPVSLVKVAGIEDASRQKGGWHRQD